MSLARTIRTPPVPHTAAECKKLLRDYGIPRWQAAKIMDVAKITMDLYLTPATCPRALVIPRLRWDALMRDIERRDAIMAGAK